MASSIAPAPATFHEAEPHTHHASLPAFPVHTPLEWPLIRSRLAFPLRLGRPITLHLFRHGETINNRNGRNSGSLDVPLTDCGREQARRLGSQLLKHYDLAICSQLARSRETLELAVEAGRAEAEWWFREPRLSERSLGILEGRPIRHLNPYSRGELGYAPRGGDSYETVTLRVLSFLLDLHDWSLEHDVDSVAISTHMGPLRIIVGILREIDDPVQVLAQHFDNANVLAIDWTRLSWPLFLRS